MGQPLSLRWNKRARSDYPRADTGGLEAKVFGFFGVARLVGGARADARPYPEKDGRTTLRPRHGRFWDYRAADGRLILFQGEVAWVMEAGDFLYWRGPITRWQA